eukprot:jgi/Botrbrau1/2990/Bobra.0026s0050.1
MVSWLPTEGLRGGVGRKSVVWWVYSRVGKRCTLVLCTVCVFTRNTTHTKAANERACIDDEDKGAYTAVTLSSSSGN